MYQVRITWEMFDHETEREFVGSINELSVKTIAEAQAWIRKQIPERETDSTTIDAILLDQVGNFQDCEGIPCDSRAIGMLEPAVGEWFWINDPV